ncbi:MAG: lysophospholipid acyltransferase family protein [Thermoleophilaceae bacterium]
MPARLEDAVHTDVARALESVDTPSAHEAVVGYTPLRDRLLVSPRMHRLLPDRAAMWLAAGRARVLWRLSEKRRQRARAQAALMFEGTPLEPNLDSIAPRLAAEEAMRSAQKPRMWMTEHYPVEGLGHLESALAEGRGAIVFSVHMGAYCSVAWPLAHAGHPSYMTGADWLYADVYEGREALTTLIMRSDWEKVGGRWVPRGGSYDVLKALLERGELCLVMLDVPGSTNARFLGKPAHLASGLARLARDTGAPLVPAFCHGGSARPRLVVEPPIDPAAFDSEDRLVKHLADVGSRAILEVSPESWEPNDFPPLIFRELGEKHGWAFR